MKKQTFAEYTNRVRKILKSKLTGGNTIQTINNWAVPVIMYTVGIVDWTIAEPIVLYTSRVTLIDYTFREELGKRTPADQTDSRG